jgi:transcriptional regulator with XRE-family HTH domain
MELTEAVKTLRGRLNESQQAFATRLGISIRGLVNYEKDRDPPLTLLLKLAAVARAVKDESLSELFQLAFFQQIAEATHGHRVSFLHQEDGGGDNAGLLLTTFGNGQLDYASAFLTALNRMRYEEDVATREEARKVLDRFVSSVFVGMKTLRPAVKRK